MQTINDDDDMDKKKYIINDTYVRFSDSLFKH